MGLSCLCVEVEPTMAPKNKNVGKPRNYALESGVYRFGKSKTYRKKAVYKFIKKKTAKKAVKPAPTFVEKQINGAKNGGKRMVRVKRLRNDVPTMDKAAKGTSTKFFSKQKRTLRPSLASGTVAIVLAGAHKGKRVIVLKQLASGLVLVTGPLKLNGCPMRRINQRYLLATKTSVDVSAVSCPKTSMMIISSTPRLPRPRRPKEETFSQPKRKNTRFQMPARPTKKRLTNKCWMPSRNIPKALH